MGAADSSRESSKDLVNLWFKGHVGLAEVWGGFQSLCQVAPEVTVKSHLPLLDDLVQRWAQLLHFRFFLTILFYIYQNKVIIHCTAELLHFPAICLCFPLHCFIFLLDICSYKHFSPFLEVQLFKPMFKIGHQCTGANDPISPWNVKAWICINLHWNYVWNSGQVSELVSG